MQAAQGHSRQRTSRRPLHRAPHKAGTSCPTQAPCQSEASSVTCLSCPHTAAGPSTSSCSCMPTELTSQIQGRYKRMSASCGHTGIVGHTNHRQDGCGATTDLSPVWSSQARVDAMPLPVC